MPASFVVLLALAVLVLVALRVVGVLPITVGARPLGRVGALLGFVGLVALVLHCTAMFFPALGRAAPLGARLTPVVNAMGPASVALYAVPAVLVLVAARHLHPVAVAVDAVALAVVGITMYDHGPLRVHLVAIAVAVIALAVTGVAFVGGIGGRRA